MSEIICQSCLKPKANLECGLCHAPVCKSCAQFLEEESFSFYPTVPPELRHTCYCGNCFAETVVPAQEIYHKLMSRAKNVQIYDKTQGKETRLKKRLDTPLRVENCDDREEVVLRLAFLAVQMNCNMVVDVALTSVKIKNGSYQTTKWSGSGTPIQP